MVTIRINDQVNAQALEAVHVLRWKDNLTCTLRLLLEERISIEYDRARGTDGEGYANHLVHLPPHKQCTPEGAIEAGLEGFKRQSFFVIVNGRQITDLDEEIALLPEIDINFVKLVPLQGG